MLQIPPCCSSHTQLSPAAPNPSLPHPLSTASHLVPRNTQGRQRWKKGPGGFRFSTQVGKELFLHPWDLGHPPTAPSDPGSGSGAVLSSPLPKHHEPGEDLDISGALQHHSRSCLGYHPAQLALSPMVVRLSRWPGARATLRGCWGQAGSGSGWKGKVCWDLRVLGQGPGEWGVRPDLREVQIGAGSVLSGASGPAGRSGLGVGIRVQGLVRV